MAQFPILTPMEHVRIKQQICTGKTSMVETCQSILSQNGLRGLYQGNGLTLVREFIGSSSYFLIYEVIMRLLVNQQDRPNMSMWMPLLGGGLAGSGSWFLAYPVDIVKTQIQADCLQFPQYRNAMHCYSVI